MISPAPSPWPQPRGISRARRTAVALGVTALVAGTGAVMAAFTATTANPGNGIATGTVVIEDNDADSRMFGVFNEAPGDPVSRCITVTYTGSLPSTVRMYWGEDTFYTAANSANFTVQIDRVATAGLPAVDADCTAPSLSVAHASTDLSALPKDFATGVPGKAGDAPWAPGDAVGYKITLTPKDDTVPNRRAVYQSPIDVTFTWEARNT